MSALSEWRDPAPPTGTSSRRGTRLNAIEEPIPFAALDREHAALAVELRDAFDRVVRQNAFVLGEEVERFEAAWATACGTRECVGAASGTAALTLLLRAAGIGPGDEVIVPAHTYIATALAVVHAGAIPVLCDVDGGTGLLDPRAAADVIGPRTAAVMPVHLYGQLCDMPAVCRLAERHSLLVLEDAAQAHGAAFDGRPAGGFGSGAGFSFYPSKNLGALGDGGAICTNDAAVAERARRLRNLGQRAKGDHVVAGANERLDGLQAAFLSAKLKQLPAGNAARRHHASSYRAALDGRVRLLQEREVSPCVYHLFPVRVRKREQVGALLCARGVETGVHYPLPLHGQPALRGMVVARGDMSHAEAWAREELSLPMSPKLRPDEVSRAARECARAVAEVEA